MLLHVFGSPVCVRVWLCPKDPAGSFGERTLRAVALWASTTLVSIAGGEVARSTLTALVGQR